MQRATLILALFLALAWGGACRGEANVPAEAPVPEVIKPRKPAGPAHAMTPGDWDALRFQRFVLKDEPVFQMLLVGPPQTGGMRSGRVVLLPGQRMERHSTEENEEMLVFLKGTTRVVLGDETVTMSANQALYVPPNTQHELINDGQEEARYVFTVAPPQR